MKSFREFYTLLMLDQLTRYIGFNIKDMHYVIKPRVSNLSLGYVEVPWSCTRY